MAEENYYPLEKVVAIVAECRRLMLSVRAGFYDTPATELVRIFNGCGPDSWTDSMRFAATWLYRNFQSAIGIHDYEFQHADGKLETLKIVNDNFLKNCKLELDDKYPLVATWRVWRYPLRAAAWSKIQFAYFALCNGSEEAWESAHERFQEAK